jgi:hypothetical protein
LNPRPKVSAPHVTAGLRNLPSGDSREDATLGSRVLIHSPRADYSSDGFREWLILQGKTQSTIKEIVNYAKSIGISWIQMTLHGLRLLFIRFIFSIFSRYAFFFFFHLTVIDPYHSLISFDLLCRSNSVEQGTG